MDTNPPSLPQPRLGFWAQVARFFGFLLRLVFVILLAVGVGAGVYFGVPWVSRSLIEPVQAHTAQITALQDQAQNTAANTDKAQATQDARLTGLETGGDAVRARAAAAETAVAQMRAALDAEAATRAALATRVADLQTAQQMLADKADQQAAALAVLEPAATTTAAEAAVLKQRVTLLRLRDRLLLARLQAVAQNQGELRQLLTQAAGELTGFVTKLEALPQDVRSALTVRLATAQALIESQPVTALDEMESVWSELDRTLNPAAP